MNLFDMFESGKKQDIEEACWKGYHKEGMKTMFGKRYPNCVKNKNESLETYVNKGECPGCGGVMVSEEQINEKQDACYHKVKSRYKVWPSAYASGALVQCRKKGAANWGNKNESITQEEYDQLDENLKQWFSDKWVRFGPDGKIRGDCARGDSSEGKPKCLPQSKAHALGKKGRASAAARKRREDPNPERSGKAINVNTKKKSNEGVAEGYEPGDKVTWYYSNHYPKVEGTVVGIKDGKYRIKSVSPLPGQEHTDPAIYAVPKNNIMSHTKQGVAEGLNDTIYPNAEVIKSKNGKPVGEIYQDGNSWGAFHYRADRGYDFIDSREEAIEALRDLHQETGRSRPDYTIKGVAEGLVERGGYQPSTEPDTPEQAARRQQSLQAYQAQQQAPKPPIPDGEYQRRLQQYKIGGRGAGWGFQPKPEDAAAAEAERAKLFGPKTTQQSGTKVDEQGVAEERIQEIQRKPDDPVGYSTDNRIVKSSDLKGLKMIPGSNRLGYSFGPMVTAFTGATHGIHLYDIKNRRLIGYLALAKSAFPLPKSYRVANVNIDDDYRGQGLGQTLYGIAIKLLGLTIEADDTQTAAARRMWVALSQIPGVEINGYAKIWADEWDKRDTPNEIYDDSELRVIRALIKAGGEELGRSHSSVYVSFPVGSNADKSELQSIQKGLAIYSRLHPEDGGTDNGLYARWGGQVREQSVAEGSNKKQEATRRIQKMLNDKFGANLDVDGVLGPLTLKSINKFMPNAKVGPAEDPNKTTAVQGKKVKNEDTDQEQLAEKWSQKYKSSINCSNPKGFSQRAHCDGKKKNEDVTEAFQNDEANLYYIYDPSDGRLKQRMVSNYDERQAFAQGFKDTPEKALRAHGIIRSKFNPTKWVQKQGTRWVEVFPFGRPELEETAEYNYSNINDDDWYEFDSDGNVVRQSGPGRYKLPFGSNNTIKLPNGNIAAKGMTAKRLKLFKNLSESREYYNVTSTDSASLRQDFNMSKDRFGWYLSEGATPKHKLDAYRAFGSPKLKEYDLSAFSGGTQTKGEDNVISPVGSQTRSQYKK